MVDLLSCSLRQWLFGICMVDSHVFFRSSHFLDGGCLFFRIMHATRMPAVAHVAVGFNAFYNMEGTDPVVPEVFFLDMKKSRLVYFGAVSSPFWCQRRMSAVADIAVGLGALYDMEEIDSVAPRVFALEMKPVQGLCALMPFHLRFCAGGGCRRLRMSRWVLMPSAMIWRGPIPLAQRFSFWI